MPSNEVEAIRKEVGCKCRDIILRLGWDWPLVLGHCWRRASMAAAYGAGLRTNALVAAGAAMFVMLSALAVPPDDSFRIAGQVVWHWFPGSRGNSAKRAEHQRVQHRGDAVMFGGDWEALGLTDSSTDKNCSEAAY